MDLKQLTQQFSDTRERQIKGVFANLFMVQNKLQTLFDNSGQGITVKQFMLLIMVRRAEKPQTFTQMGEMLGCSRQNIKKLADVLVHKGFVTISASPSDARTWVITPTTAVEEYFVKMEHEHNQMLTRLFATCSDQDIAGMYRVLASLHDSIAQAQQVLPQNMEE